MISDVEQLFVYLLAICTYIFWQVSSPLPIFKSDFLVVVELQEFFTYPGY